MNEDAWLAGTVLAPLLNAVRGAGYSERKRRLLDCACGRYLLPWAPGTRAAKALERAERHADGSLTNGTLRRWCRTMAGECQQCYQSPDAQPKQWMACHVIYLTCLQQASGLAWGELRYQETGYRGQPELDFFTAEWVQSAEGLAVRLIRDIFGNPFRPVSFSPEWRTDTALSLARGMYDSRDFSAMPILADALQDAGCDSDDILNHCRDPHTTHVRGCWVVDLLLGKA